MKNLNVDGFATRNSGAGQPNAVIGLQDVQSAVVRLPIFGNTSADYLKVEGMQTKNIVLHSTGKGKQPVKYSVAPGVKQEVTIN